jgi:hypothetical protein
MENVYIVFAGKNNIQIKLQTNKHEAHCTTVL